MSKKTKKVGECDNVTIEIYNKSKGKKKGKMVVSPTTEDSPKNRTL